MVHEATFGESIVAKRGTQRWYQLRKKGLVHVYVHRVSRRIEKSSF